MRLQVFSRRLRSSIVHQIRNSVKYVASKNQKEFKRDLKLVYQTVNKDAAEKALDDLSMRLMSVDDLSNRGENALRTQVSEMRRRFEVVNAKLSPAAGLSRMETLSERCSSLYSRAEASVGRRFDTAASRLESLSGRLESLNPLNVLSRGYGLITDSEGRAVTSVDGVATGDRVTINLRDGSASARIEEKVRK